MGPCFFLRSHVIVLRDYRGRGMKLDNIKYENEDIFENKDNQDFDNQ